MNVVLALQSGWLVHANLLDETAGVIEVMVPDLNKSFFIHKDSATTRVFADAISALNWLSEVSSAEQIFIH